MVNPLGRVSGRLTPPSIGTTRRLVLSVRHRPVSARVLTFRVVLTSRTVFLYVVNDCDILQAKLMRLGALTTPSMRL